MTLGCRRDLFEIPDDITYLNVAYISPSSRVVRAAGERGIARKSRPWEIGWPDFFTQADEARATYARLIGAEGADIAIVPSASFGIEVAAANLPLRAGQAIVTLADQFPSNVYAWQNLARRNGGRIVAVPCPADWDWTAAICAAIDETVAIVALPNSHWTNGTVLDLVRIGERCRAVGAALSLDLTQSLGVLPFDVAAVQPDFMVCASYKWLMGPYSLSYLYAAPHRQEGRPIENSPFAREGVREPPDWNLESMPYPDSFMPGARRYDVGQTANFALMPMSIAATEQILDWRPERIAATLSPLIAHAAARGTAIGLGMPAAEVRAPHMLGFRLPRSADPARLRDAFTKHRIFLSLRCGNLRISPHIYNDLADIDRLFDVLEEVLG